MEHFLNPLGFYFTYPLGKEHIESVCAGEGLLKKTPKTWMELWMLKRQISEISELRYQRSICKVTLFLFHSLFVDAYLCCLSI